MLNEELVENGEGLMVTDELELVVTAEALELNTNVELELVITVEVPDVDTDDEIKLGTVDELELLLLIVTIELVEDDKKLVVKELTELLLEIELEEDVGELVAMEATLDRLLESELDELLDDRLAVLLGGKTEEVVPLDVEEPKDELDE